MGKKLEINECELDHEPKLISMDYSTSQTSNDHGKKLMRVGDNLIKFRFSRLKYIYIYMKIISFRKMSDVGQRNVPWINYKAFTPCQPSNEYEFNLIRGMKGQINIHT